MGVFERRTLKTASRQSRVGSPDRAQTRDKAMRLRCRAPLQNNTGAHRVSPCRQTGSRRGTDFPWAPREPFHNAPPGPHADSTFGQISIVSPVRVRFRAVARPGKPAVRCDAHPQSRAATGPMFPGCIVLSSPAGPHCSPFVPAFFPAPQCLRLWPATDQANARRAANSLSSLLGSSRGVDSTNLS
jgi:hypothetical protein